MCACLESSVLFFLCGDVEVDELLAKEEEDDDEGDEEARQQQARSLISVRAIDETEAHRWFGVILKC